MASPTMDVAPRNNDPQHGAYAIIGGIPPDVTVPRTLVQRAKAEGKVAYEALKATAEVLYGCSDIFLPVKTAVGLFLEIDKSVDVS